MLLCMHGIALTPLSAQTPSTVAPTESDPAAAATARPTSPIATATDAVDASLSDVTADTELDETVKATATQLYQQAKQQLQTAQASRENANQFSAMAEQADAKIAELSTEPASSEVPSIAGVVGEGINAIRARLAKARLELSEMDEKVAALTSEPARRQRRLTEIPNEIAQAEADMAVINDQMGRAVPANETLVETQARAALLSARKLATENRLSELNLEQAAYVATNDLLPLRRTRTQLDAKRLRDEVDLLQEALTNQQQEKAIDTTETLRAEVDAVDDSLKSLAKTNVALSEQHQTLIHEAAIANKILNETKEAFESVKADLKESQDRVDAVGLTDALGLMLRKRRQEYETLKNRYQPSDDLTEKIRSYQIDLFELEDESSQLAEKIAAAEASRKNGPAIPDEASAFSEELRLLVTRKQLVDDTLQTQSELLQTLVSGDTIRRQLRRAITEFNDFVDKQVFWIRSSPPFSLGELKSIRAVITWLVSPEHWRETLRAAYDGFLSQPLTTLLALIGLGALFGTQPNVRKRIREEGGKASRYNAQYKSTVMTLVNTILSACAWPALFAVLGWTIMNGEMRLTFAEGVSMGLLIVALFVASRQLLREVCVDGGLADAHFGWHESVRSLLRFHLRWYTAFGGIIIFLVMLVHEHPDTVVRASADRLTTTSLFVLIALFHHVILRPNSVLYVQIADTTPVSNVYRFRKTIWAVLVGLPLVFAIMSLAGYLDTAYRLGQLLQISILLLVMVVLVIGMMFRWLTLHHRDAAIRQAKEKREKRLVAAKLAESDVNLAEEGIELKEEETTDLPTLDRQTRRTVTTVATVVSILLLAYIWSDVLPALDILDKVQFWDVGVGENVVVVTLKDVVYTIAAIVATVYAVRNLPGLLDLLVLRQSPLDSGARYALTTLFRYVLTVVGILLVLSLLSIPYTQLGWLLAAISVGLGFGLQEIVANFVSGVIVLLERPVRVGDVVTIDGTTGIVSRIQMRATTVTGWDRKELVVPNKSLITDKLLNWSLTNVINRVCISVGTSYDSDPDQVRSILSQILTQHPDVMEDPAPLINLEEFGDNSLNFTARFFLANLDRRIGVTHEINTSILRAFREANISIPFPQRDLHLIVDNEQPPFPLRTTRRE